MLVASLVAWLSWPGWMPWIIPMHSHDRTVPTRALHTQSTRPECALSHPYLYGALIFLARFGSKPSIDWLGYAAEDGGSVSENGATKERHGSFLSNEIRSSFQSTLILTIHPSIG
jgi:hypothetical protein